MIASDGKTEWSDEQRNASCDECAIVIHVWTGGGLIMIIAK